MASTAILQDLLFRPPASLFVTVVTVVNLTALVSFGLNEMRGKHLQYSKMAGTNNSSSKIPSKAGMTGAYLPAFVFGTASFFIFSDDQSDCRFFLIRAALALHFLKRLLETWFVHIYSGSMTIETIVIISGSYLTATLTMIYTQHLSLELPNPSIDLKYVGAAMFVIGECGNFYHHRLLSSLRRKGEKDYKIPKGGLFDVVICPHYLFELVAFWGFTFIAQTWFSLGSTLGTTVYLLGRTHATRKWYTSKFEDFPRHRKALIPYIF